ncbi:hypothetical protein V0288_05360 [Pannus brasiliensis CCIBt3594]|uniref:Uncharacterized protein n=1 Tax=Pannus brasiliensis CCIBt3594 TaxID=1427578 RepID=A0AAW9QMZ8_9CHRO
MFYRAFLLAGSGVRRQESGDGRQETGDRSQESGVRSQEVEYRIIRAKILPLTELPV